MAQLSDDAFAAGDRLMPVDEALALLRARVHAVAETERVGLIDADGRVLAESLIAPIDLPVFDNSAVDGYAARFADFAAVGETILPVVGRLTAGGGAAAALAPGAVARIFTGAPAPAGADTIFMQEDVRVLGDGRVVLPAGLKRGANLRPRGEDIARGAVALEAGRRLTPQDIGLAAALGMTHLIVRRPLRAAVFSTGDEIVSPGAALAPAQLYDSNRFVLQTLLRRLGCRVSDLGVLPDDRAAVRAALIDAARDHDVVLTSGGVSLGEEDHVKAALAEAGSLTFWRLAIKPGRPVAMGLIGGTPFIGLPGNPVAVFVTFATVARALIAALSGAREESLPMLSVRCAFAYRKKPGRREYVRVRLVAGADGVTAEKYAVEGAGVITSLTRTHGLIELGEDATSLSPGDMAPFIDYAALR
jgi:molybdopterin molybdotransferase